MSKKTDGKTMQYGYFVTGDTIRRVDPAATSDTATKRAEKAATKAGIKNPTTFVVEADSRTEADATADALYQEMYAVADSGVEPTPEDLAEAAAEKDADDTNPAAEAAKRTGTKAGFYNVATNTDGETVAVSVPERDEETAKAVALPWKSGEVTDVIVVKAKSRDHAIQAYEALEGNFPSSGTVVATRQSRSSGGGSRRTKGPLPIPAWDAFVPKEADNGKYLIAKTGTLHVDPDCRFVKPGNHVVLTDDTKTATSRVFEARAAQDADALPTADDGKTRAHQFCIFCASTKVAADKTEAAASA